MHFAAAVLAAALPLQLDAASLSVTARPEDVGFPPSG